MNHIDRQAVGKPCHGCTQTLKRGPTGWIAHLHSRRVAPICSRCSERARGDSIFLEQLAAALAIGASRKSIENLLRAMGREMPTTVEGLEEITGEGFIALGRIS